jgi:hypothetical protein
MGDNPTEKNSSRTIEQLIWSWVVVGTIIIFILGAGISFMTSNHPIMADLFFTLGAGLFLSKFLTWELSKQHKKRIKIYVITIGITSIALTVSICDNHYLNPAQLTQKGEQVEISKQPASKERVADALNKPDTIPKESPPKVPPVQQKPQLSLSPPAKPTKRIPQAESSVKETSPLYSPNFKEPLIAKLPPTQSIPQPPKESMADVGLYFVYPKSPVLMIENLSDSLVRDIKWTVQVWNMDLPDRNDSLPIPIQTFDWVKGHDQGGPLGIFNSPLVSPLLKDGNRLFGSASVDCPTCTRGRTYIVYIVWGQGGWYSELENEKDGRIIVPKNALRDGREAYFKALEVMIPEINRLPIKEQ